MSTPLEQITSRAALAEFVRVNRESKAIEYKRLRDLASCRHCDYCRRADGRTNDRDQDPAWAGVVIARAVASMANEPGGHVVIGVKRHDEASGEHELEDRACPNLTYSPEMVLTAIREHTQPVVPVQVTAVTDGRPPAYVIGVRSLMSLVAWTDPSGNQQLYHRHDASNVPLDVSEIDFLVRTKANVSANREIREEISYQIWDLFDAVLDRPSTRAVGQELTYEKIVALDPYGVSTIRSTRRSAVSPNMERAVLEMPSKMAVYSSPRDIEIAVDMLADISSDVAHGTLDPCERGLIAAAGWLVHQRKTREKLSPFDILLEVSGEDSNLVQSEFTAGYDESFERVYDRLKGMVHTQFWNDRTKKQSIYYLADALTLLLPRAFEVLRFYLQLREMYGPEATATPD